MAIDIKKIKSLFVVDEEQKKNEIEKTEETKDIANTTPTTNQTAQNKIDDGILSTLSKALADNNIQGFDYFEFKQSLKNLKEMLDEITAFKSAFATASTLNVTKQKLIESAQFYLKVLDKEKENFNKALNSQGAGNIEQKVKEVDRLKETILSKSEQIKKLTTEITQHQNSIAELQKYIQEAQNKIQTTAGNFEVTFSKIYNEIKLDIDKINNIIK